MFNSLISPTNSGIENSKNSNSLMITVKNGGQGDSYELPIDCLLTILNYLPEQDLYRFNRVSMGSQLLTMNPRLDKPCIARNILKGIQKIISSILVDTSPQKRPLSTPLQNPEYTIITSPENPSLVCEVTQSTFIDSKSGSKFALSGKYLSFQDLQRLEITLQLKDYSSQLISGTPTAAETKVIDLAVSLLQKKLKKQMILKKYW